MSFDILSVLVAIISLAAIYFVSNAFYDRTGTNSVIFLATSYFFLDHYGKNIEISVLGFVSLLFLHQVYYGKPAAVLVLSSVMALLGVYSLPFFVIGLISLYRQGRLSETVYLAPVVYPVVQLAGGVLDALSMFVVTEGGAQIYDYLIAVQASGPFAVVSTLFGTLFILFGLAYSYHRWICTEDQGFALLAIWIYGIVFSWIIISYPYAAATRELFNLYQSDTFLYLLAFPGAVSGSVLVRDILADRFRGTPMILAVILLLSGTYIGVDLVTEESPMETNSLALGVINGVTSEGDITLTSNHWTSEYLEAETGRIYVPTGRLKNVWGLLLADHSIWERFDITENRFFGLVVNQYGERLPRYILLTHEDIRSSPHVLEFFIEARNRFEIAYEDETSVIVRIIYFDKDYATYEPAVMISGSKVRDITPKGVVSSYDANPEYIGTESWLSKFEVDGEYLYFAVNKETGKIKGIEP